MPVASPGDPSLATARLRGKRVALGVVILACVAIIGSSALQIVPAVFGVGIVPVPDGPPGTSERECADGVRRLKDALDRAVGAAPSVAAGPSFSSRLRPEWDNEAAVFESCRRAPQGLEAWAALLRLRAAEAELAQKSSPDDVAAEVASGTHLRPGPLSGGSTDPFRADLEPLRRDITAHLPARAW
jgi:hypothetical protein